MNRAVLLCVFLCLLGSCRSDSSISSSEASTAAEVHLACANEEGLSIGEIPQPVLRVDGESIAAHYSSGYRAPCPWFVQEGTVTTLAALDGVVPLEAIDVEVATGTKLTVTILRWSDDITADYLNWSELGMSGDGREVEANPVKAGTWNIDVPKEPGDYGLTFQLHWEHGEDTWVWHVRAVG